jgi:hypothetical protein
MVTCKVEELPDELQALFIAQLVLRSSSGTTFVQ